MIPNIVKQLNNKDGNTLDSLNTCRTVAVQSKAPKYSATPATKSPAEGTNRIMYSNCLKLNGQPTTPPPPSMEAEEDKKTGGVNLGEVGT